MFDTSVTIHNMGGNDMAAPNERRGTPIVKHTQQALPDTYALNYSYLEFNGLLKRRHCKTLCSYILVSLYLEMNLVISYK